MEQVLRESNVPHDLEYTRDFNYFRLRPISWR